MDNSGNLTPNDFDLMDDLKLMGYGESDSSGCWIKLQILPDDLEKFRGLRGELFEVAMRRLDNSHKPVHAPKPYSSNAHILHKAGFFINPNVVKVIGTDEEFQDYVRSKSCCICGGFTAIYEEGSLVGESYCDYAHVRRVDRGAGTAEKPAYSGVPMCNSHHRLQHSAGEASVYNEMLKIKGKKGTNNQAVGRNWFEKQSMKYLAAWAHDKLVSDLGYSSLTQVPPKKLIDWATSEGVLYCIPTGFMKAVNEGQE